MTPPLSRRWPARWEAVVHVFVLTGFALAQPLYDLLGDQAEFFAVRGHGFPDIVLLVVLLSVVAPGALALMVVASRRVSPRLFLLLLGLLVAAGAAAFVMPLLRGLLAYSAVVNIGVSAALGAVVGLAYLRSSAIRLFVTCLSPSILIFPLVFLGFSEIRFLWSIPEPPEVEPPPLTTRTPIVMLVFDELPVTTLMNRELAIDASRFPSFAELAATATWYPNATTVAEYTVQALPALLTGAMPSIGDREKSPKRSFAEHLDLPAYRSHPRNLFAALKDQFELRVFETASSLCPKDLCTEVFDRDLRLSRRFSDLVRDLWVVYLHLSLPPGLTRDLPRIDMSWRDFVHHHQQEAGKEDDDVRAFELFIEALTPTDRPGLYFHHTGLPHGPWKFLPSGNRYQAANYSHALPANQRWRVQSRVREPLQRHLLQSMFSDRLLGRALAKLRAEGLFDEALIVVTADHGAAFTPGEHFRLIERRNWNEIVDVPLLIKSPGQRRGRVDPTPIRSVDLMPTVFSELGEVWPWPGDGRPVGGIAGRRVEQLPVITREGRVKVIDYDPDARIGTLQRNWSVIGDSGYRSIFGGPRYADLIGSAPASACGRPVDEPGLLVNPDAFRAVDPASGQVPAAIAVRSPFARLGPEELLLVAVNDRIAAVFDDEPDLDPHGRFFGMIDERALRFGDNRVEFRAADRSGPCGTRAD